MLGQARSSKGGRPTDRKLSQSLDTFPGLLLLDLKLVDLGLGVSRRGQLRFFQVCLLLGLERVYFIELIGLQKSIISLLYHLEVESLIQKFISQLDLPTKQ